MVDIKNDLEIRKFLDKILARRHNPDNYVPKVCQKDCNGNFYCTNNCCDNNCCEKKNCKDCNNIIEVKIPKNSSKRVFIGNKLSKKFINKSKYRCVDNEEYSFDENVIIENMRKIDYTPSVQALLIHNGIKTVADAERLSTRYKNRHHCPHDLYGKTNYRHLPKDGSNGLIGLPDHLRAEPIEQTNTSNMSRNISVKKYGYYF
tara:strand:+ start:126 stop:734 length:609 start_codon:yes stop_codon:yes gene_type:complete